MRCALSLANILLMKVAYPVQANTSHEKAIPSQQWSRRRVQVRVTNGRVQVEDSSTTTQLNIIIDYIFDLIKRYCYISFSLLKLPIGMTSIATVNLLIC